MKNISRFSTIWQNCIILYGSSQGKKWLRKLTRKTSVHWCRKPTLKTSHFVLCYQQFWLHTQLNYKMYQLEMYLLAISASHWHKQFKKRIWSNQKRRQWLTRTEYQTCLGFTRSIHSCSIRSYRTLSSPWWNLYKSTRKKLVLRAITRCPPSCHISLSSCRLFAMSGDIRPLLSSSRMRLQI